MSTNNAENGVPEAPKDVSIPTNPESQKAAQASIAEDLDEFGQSLTGVAWSSSTFKTPRTDSVLGGQKKEEQSDSAWSSGFFKTPGNGNALENQKGAQKDT